MLHFAMIAMLLEFYTKNVHVFCVSSGIGLLFRGCFYWLLLSQRPGNPIETPVSTNTTAWTLVIYHVTLCSSRHHHSSDFRIILELQFMLTQRMTAVGPLCHLPTVTSDWPSGFALCRFPSWDSSLPPCLLRRAVNRPVT